MGRNLAAALLTLFLAAAASAADDGPVQFPQTDLMRAAPRAVFVASMGDYRTPWVSKDWGAWADKGENGKPHEPDLVGRDGRRDVASAFYPVIGPYDMSDPDLVEYHCQLLKMAGVDGISFNLSFHGRDAWRQKSMRLYVETMQRYGLKGIVRFENKFYPHVYGDPKEALDAAYSDMDAWLKVLEPVQYKVAGRPVFMLFTFTLSPEELRAWKEHYPADRRPVVVTYGANPKYAGVVDGRFGWTADAPVHSADHPPYRIYVDPAGVRANELHDRKRAEELLKSGLMSFYVAGVSPGFDDIGCWGWGQGPRKVERDGGNTYRYRWEQVLKTDLPVVMVPTWNDWAEGTVIEPAVEFGTEYLALTREYAARFKHATTPAGDLAVPVWIYKVRKAAAGDAEAGRAMAEASRLIETGKYAEAETMAKPWATKLGVAGLGVWDPRR
jgi:hypothetical protein